MPASLHRPRLVWARVVVVVVVEAATAVARVGVAMVAEATAIG